MGMGVVKLFSFPNCFVLSSVLGFYQTRHVLCVSGSSIWINRHSYHGNISPLGSTVLMFTNMAFFQLFNIQPLCPVSHHYLRLFDYLRIQQLPCLWSVSLSPTVCFHFSILFHQTDIINPSILIGQHTYIE